jgi:hypothetical protein
MTEYTLTLPPHTQSTSLASSLQYVRISCRKATLSLFCLITSNTQDLLFLSLPLLLLRELPLVPPYREEKGKTEETTTEPDKEKKSYEALKSSLFSFHLNLTTLPTMFCCSDSNRCVWLLYHCQPTSPYRSKPTGTRP